MKSEEGFLYFIDMLPEAIWNIMTAIFKNLQYVTITSDYNFQAEKVYKVFVCKSMFVVGKKDCCWIITDLRCFDVFQLNW